MYSSEAFLMHLYLILKISNYVEIASLLEIYTFLTYKKLGHHPCSDSNRFILEIFRQCSCIIYIELLNNLEWNV